MDLELAGKVAVVTGASKGIGLAVARELAAERAHVVAGARTVAPLEGLEGIAPFSVDLIDPDGPARLIDHAVEQHGRLDVLVNNVGGVQLRLDGFENVSDADFHASLELNFFSALRAMRAAVAAMAPRGEGTIVNVTSVNAFFQPDGAVIDYGAAKAALINLTKALSQEFGPQGVRINSVSPGPVETELWLGEHGVAETVAEATGVDAATARENIVAGMGGIPSGRFTTPAEVATLVVLLASPLTANVTGANYVVDGGLIKTT
jgi:NAD(P)-dependent dehydrogenase (short-subunit alcohol dehydrogenase family)